MIDNTCTLNKFATKAKSCNEQYRSMVATNYKVCKRYFNNLIIFDHPRSGVVYNFGRVCLSVR